jgi:hypothetical protein
VIDYTSQIDIAFFPNAYDSLTEKAFTPSYFLDKNILTAYIHYSFPLTKFSSTVIKKHLYRYFWKLFVPTKHHLKEFKKHDSTTAQNVVVTGYPKMDDLAHQKIHQRNRKKIIIAPHHTVTNWKDLQLSNFLQYADFFLQLPKMYPQIDFIFRPHPLLITQLRKKEIWGEDKTDLYLNQMKKNQNVIYSDGGEYFELFANSDGIIHDCGSFLAEYLFTDKPACYILKNKRALKKWFLPIGQLCIKHSYQAFNKNDILTFINEVIIKENDPLKKKRLEFAERELKINYPQATLVALNYIKQQLMKESNS